MTTKIQPFLGNILVEAINETKTESGILIPQVQGSQQEAAGKSGKGKVLAVGHGLRRADGEIIPLLVKKGDIILFNRYAPMRIEGKEYLMVREENIIAILKKDEK